MAPAPRANSRGGDVFRSSWACAVDTARPAKSSSTLASFAIRKRVSDIVVLEVESEVFAGQRAGRELERGGSLCDAFRATLVDHAGFEPVMTGFEDGNRLKHGGPHVIAFTLAGDIAAGVQQVGMLE